MIQNILFDLGGVVVEFDPHAWLNARFCGAAGAGSMPGAAAANCAGGLGGAAKAECTGSAAEPPCGRAALSPAREKELFALTFASPVWKKLTLGQISAAQFRAELLQNAAPAGLEAETAAVVDEWAAILRDKPETTLLLPRLKSAGLHIFYLSNTEKSTVKMLEQRNYWPLFEGGIASCDVGLAKPDPAIFALALRQLGLAAAETVLIDDNADNVRAAREFGLAAVLYQNHAQLLRELAALGITF